MQDLSVCVIQSTFVILVFSWSFPYEWGELLRVKSTAAASFR
jgi:hypothetical protein